MPYKFKFQIDGDDFFTAKLISQQCSANCKNGNRCRKQVVIGLPYCYVHLLSIKHLRIKESTIANAGNGLFTQNKSAGENDIIYKKGETIGEYLGEYLNLNTMNERYAYEEGNTAPYAVEITDDTLFIDASLYRSYPSIINHSNTPNQINVKFNNPNRRVQPNTIKMVATKNIRNNTELFANYGRQYHFQNNHQTVKSRNYPEAYNKMMPEEKKSEA